MQRINPTRATRVGEASIGLAFAIALASCGPGAGPDTQAGSPADTTPSLEGAVETERDTIQIAINEWLTGWSASQAASVREICETDPDCDPTEYTPEARPETSFGWDGAESVEQIADWARGPRYRVRAHGRSVLLYLEGGRVVGAYIETPEGGRRNLCRENDCYPESQHAGG